VYNVQHFDQYYIYLAVFEIWLEFTGTKMSKLEYLYMYVLADLFTITLSLIFFLGAVVDVIIW
jgi:hypothetical protein